MIAADYDFAGSHVRIAASSEKLLAQFDPLLGALRASLPDKADFLIELKEAHLPDIPTNARILHDGPTWEEQRTIYADDGGARYFSIPGKAFLRLPIDGALAELIVGPNHHDAIEGLAGIHAVDAAISATGQLLLHGAVLSLPDRASAILLHAPSGTGKTTTTLRLALDGFGIFTDDAAVVRTRDEVIEIWGLPRALKIHQKTAQLLPPLTRLLGSVWDANGEQSVPKSRLAEIGIQLEGRTPLPMAACVMLARNAETSGGRTHVQRASPTEALFALVEDNIRGSAAGVPEFQLRKLSPLADMMRRLPVLECRMGHDFENVSARLLAALQSLK